MRKIYSEKMETFIAKFFKSQFYENNHFHIKNFQEIFMVFEKFFHKHELEPKTIIFYCFFCWLNGKKYEYENFSEKIEKKLFKPKHINCLKVSKEIPVYYEENSMKKFHIGKGILIHCLEFSFKNDIKWYLVFFHYFY